MALRHEFRNEAALAETTVLWLERFGWSCFNEVECSGGRADIVAVRGSVVWIVETKLTLGADVYLQCLQRQRECVNGVVMAVPYYRGNWNLWARFAERDGIGLVRMSPRYDWVELDVVPRLRRVDTSRIRGRLLPEMRENAPGVQGGAGQTRFGILASRMSRELTEGTVAEVVKRGVPSLNMYRDDEAESASRRALAFYLQRGLIPGWTLEKRGGRLHVVRNSVDGKPEED